jgi:hypothetical protein
VLSFIAEDNGGNTLDEEKRGKALSGLDLPVQQQLGEDDEEEEKETENYIGILKIV